MPVDIAECRRFLEQREAARQSALDRRFAQAWHDFRAITHMLIRQYRPRRIYQWGSLLNRQEFSEISDIDIAVEGIQSAERFFALFGDADQLSRCSLDLVELERMEPEFADLIRLKGALVYDRESENPGPHFRGGEGPIRSPTSG
jgi:predicted nucleotidyltransferase